jgi:hypothetical protein
MIVSDLDAIGSMSVCRTFEAVGDLSLAHDIKEDILKFLLKRVKLAGNPSEEGEEADDDLKDATKHTVTCHEGVTGMLGMVDTAPL